MAYTLKDDDDDDDDDEFAHDTRNKSLNNRNLPDLKRDA
jgi:hypothetical protein